MRATVQLFGSILFVWYSAAVAQSTERLWLSTTSPAPLKSTTNQPLKSSTFSEKTLDSPLSILTAVDNTPNTPTPLNSSANSEAAQNEQVPVPSQIQPATPVVSEESIVGKTSADEFSKPVIGDSQLPQQDILNDKTTTENLSLGTNKMKPRKWMSVPSEQIELIPSSPEVDLEEPSNASLNEPLDELSTNNSSESSIEFLFPFNIATEEIEEEQGQNDSVPMFFEEDIPLLFETIISKRTTVFVTYFEAEMDYTPIYVNLTGIRDFTGTERQMDGGILDLSDLYINGDEAKEVIQRMARYKFHRLDLSGNRIEEFPSNTFSPVAFTVRELRLDGNPLLSNTRGQGSVLQRGGLFHLTELRELHVKNCGLEDIDFFTPWNSNQLEVVDLSCNQLRSVPTNLQFFHKMKKLNLDGNPITTVSELPFTLLWNLQVLSLSNCVISSITSDPFRNMEHLKELSLDGNNLTNIGYVRLPRASYGVKLFLSSNPWHCACDMLTFIEHYHYAIRDLEDIRCASPRWLEGLRTAYLTKEILSLDSVDGDCTSQKYAMPGPVSVVPHFKSSRADHLELLALIVFFLAAVFMIIHILCTKKKDKFKFEDERTDINYIRIDKKSIR